MKGMLLAGLCAGLAFGACAAGVADFDPRMAVAKAVVTNGVRWIEALDLPMEGRAFAEVDRPYDRLPANVTTNVNGGVRGMKCHTAGEQVRFRTDSRKLHFRWKVIDPVLAMDHMPASGKSGIDVYRFDAARGRWFYVATGRITDPEAGSLSLNWKPGEACLVNLPLYNGVKELKVGFDPGAKVECVPHGTGITKPVVFYGTSITHGGCASRPGLSFVNLVGRDLDVPVVNLGFSGSGKMELEMSEHLAAIDASCYVLDCIWNMHDRLVVERFEPFVRSLRAKRPDVPIVIAEHCYVFSPEPAPKDRFIRGVYDKLVAEGWKKLVYLPKTEMYSGDGEGTVDGIHPNDLGMRTLATAYAGAVREALFTGGEDATKVLMVGNSFSHYLIYEIPKVARACGVKLDIASLYSPACTLKRHCDFIADEEAGRLTTPAYTWTRNMCGLGEERRNNVCAALKLRKWDVVTIQQASGDSWKGETYRPWGDTLVAKIRELAPQAKIVVQETWSYTPFDARLKKWKLTPEAMYEKVHAANETFAEAFGFDRILMGTAVQEWRRRLPVVYTENSFGGDVVGGRSPKAGGEFVRGADGKWQPNSDVFHLARPKGEYFQALVWAAKLLGADVTKCAYRPNGVTADEARLMQEIAMEIARKGACAKGASE